MKNCTIVFVLAAALAGCSAQAGISEDGEGSHIVPNGKADNYYSDVAAEFEVTGQIPVEMTEAEFLDETVREEKAIGRITAVGLHLTAYLTDKFEGIDKDGDGIISEDEIFFRNVGYGGFYAMVRNYTIEDVDVEATTEGYLARFTMDMGGPPDLLSRIPASNQVSGPQGGLAFDLQLPKGKTVDPAEVPRGDFRNFDPSTYTGELETVVLSARALPVPGNAYPDYMDFTVDGVFDITMFFGYDYNDPRSDLREMEEAYYTLTSWGFESPVGNYSDLTAESGPFTKQVIANGRPVTIEVRIFGEPMFIGNRGRQHDLALSEVATRDAFFYNGHAGPYYGFYLDEAKAASVNYWEFEEADFAQKQQFVVAQGCQTYSQYADMLYANPVKNEDNLDVITTVNYSYGIGTLELLNNLVRTDINGNHNPADFYKMVSQLNAEYWNQRKQVFYGVSGIDGNPQLHPYANPAAVGLPCGEAADCGDPVGNVCAELSGAKTCAARALAAEACPAGSTYGFLASGQIIEQAVCY